MVDLRVWSTVSFGILILGVAAGTFYYSGKKRLDKYTGHKNKLAAMLSGAFGSQKDYPV